MSFLTFQGGNGGETGVKKDRRGNDDGPRRQGPRKDVTRVSDSEAGPTDVSQLALSFPQDVTAPHLPPRWHLLPPPDTCPFMSNQLASPYLFFHQLDTLPHRTAFFLEDQMWAPLNTANEYSTCNRTGFEWMAMIVTFDGGTPEGKGRRDLRGIWLPDTSASDDVDINDSDTSTCATCQKSSYPPRPLFQVAHRIKKTRGSQGKGRTRGRPTRVGHLALPWREGTKGGWRYFKTKVIKKVHWLINPFLEWC